MLEDIVDVELCVKEFIVVVVLPIDVIVPIVDGVEVVEGEVDVDV